VSEQMSLPGRFDGEVKWVPVSAAAASLGVTETRVYQLIGNESLSAVKVNRTWLVSVRSINARIQLLRSEEEQHVA